MTFTETWYSDAQCEKVAEIARTAPEGCIVEIGSWEGFSSAKIANAVAPRILYCIDHWLGNIEEDENHPSVQAARERDVFATFMQNMRDLTNGNVIPIKMRWQDAWPIFFVYEPIAFIHIDAAHDYDSVYNTIAAIWPQLVSGGIMCGDDFQTASISRTDLHGGVEGAVRDYFESKNVSVQSDRNLWWVVA